MRARITHSFLLLTWLFGVPAFGEEPVMYAHFIYVGQGDATLLEFPCGAILIDTGSQSNEHTDDLIQYLTDFFSRRADLNNTLDSVIITHNHIDHTRGLRKVAEKFRVRNYIESGQHDGRTGTGNPRWMFEEHAPAAGITTLAVADSKITDLPHRRGLTNDTIDPLACPNCDPRIRILAARFDSNPGWPPGVFSNKNNHSLVVRVDFGESSFLFTGDLEEEAIDLLVDYYEGTETLDVDVYQVGHHGSHNGTTWGLLQATTPEIAVLSMGRKEDDLGSRTFNAYQFGHPRRVIVEQLTSAIHRNRSQAINAQVADGARRFSSYVVRRKIYATGWDGTVKVRADLQGQFRVTLDAGWDFEPLEAAEAHRPPRPLNRASGDSRTRRGLFRRIFGRKSQ